MKRILLGGSRFTLDDLSDVAARRARVGLSAAGRRAITAARHTVERALARRERAYGINTGFGKFAEVDIGLEDIEALQRNLVRSHAVGVGDPLPPFDVHCPLASLPLACKTELDTIPADIPYLQADEERIAKWRPVIERLAAPRVAIAWAGRTTHLNDRNRSIALARLDPLLSLETVQFVSIQRELRGDDAELLARHPRITHLGADLADMADTAAVAALVDLVISVDTSVVHLAGAMGRPVWVTLPFCPDWRWTLDRERSPWYPNARLFRQNSIDDWDGVIARLRDELAHFARS